MKFCLLVLVQVCHSSDLHVDREAEREAGNNEKFQRRTLVRCKKHARPGHKNRGLWWESSDNSNTIDIKSKIEPQFVDVWTVIGQALIFFFLSFLLCVAFANFSFANCSQSSNSMKTHGTSWQASRFHFKLENTHFTCLGACFRPWQLHIFQIC